MLDLKGRYQRLSGRFERFIDEPIEAAGRARRAAVVVLRFGWLCWRQVIGDRLIVVAGHLTFKTLLGLIPALVLFLLVINFFWHGPETSRAVQDALFRALNISEIRIAVDGQDVDLARKIEEMVEAARAHINAAAAVGILILFYLTMSVLATVEEAMNRIWGTRIGRPLWRRAILFWLFLTLGPPAVAVLYYASLYISNNMPTLPEWLQVIWGGALVLAANVFVLLVLYKLLPSAPVKFSAALAGAVVAGTLWHFLAKTAFEFYIHRAVGYGQMYGNLAVVPVFFLWLYVTWLTVLFGFEVAYIFQNFKALKSAHALERRRDAFPAADFVALVAMAVVARRFREGRGAAPIALLVEATGLGRSDLEELVGRLEVADLVARTVAGDALGGAVLPSRDPRLITAADVIRAVRSRLPVPVSNAHVALYREVRAAWDRLETDRGAAAGRLTLADLAGTAAATENVE